MPSNKTYNVSSTANNKVDPDSLTKEIQQSSITVALDYITTDSNNINIFFKANISSGQETTLDTIISNHEGIKENPPTMLLNKDGIAVVSLSGAYGVKQTYISHNWCDRTSWWQQSTFKNNIVAVNSGNNILYNLPTPEKVIDVTHWKIADEATDPTISSKQPVVKVNSVNYVENYYVGVTKQMPTNGYDIDYTTGAITFNQALSAEDEVTISYYTPAITVANDPYGTRASAWELKAPAGEKVVLKFAEVQWSSDVRMQDAFRFVPYYITGKDSAFDAFLQSVNVILPPGYHLPLTMLDPAIEKRFPDMYSLVEDSDDCYKVPATPEAGRTIRDLPFDQTVYRFNYQGTNNMVLDEVKGYYIRIWLQDDVACLGNRATITIYGTRQTE